MVVVMQPTWKFQIVGSRIVRPYMVYMWENPTCYCCMGVYFSMVYHQRVKPSQIVCHDCHPFLKKAWSIENKTNPNLKLLTVQKKATCEVCPLIDYFIGLSFSRCRDCRAWIREKKKQKHPSTYPALIHKRMAQHYNYVQFPIFAKFSKIAKVMSKSCF